MVTPVNRPFSSLRLPRDGKMKKPATGLRLYAGEREAGQLALSHGLAKSVKGCYALCLQGTVQREYCHDSQERRYRRNSAVG